MTKNKMAGFTLIELMIVVAIIALISAFAYPAYQDYANKARRSDAMVALMNAAQDLERCYTEYNAYNNAKCTFGAASAENYYKLTAAGTTASAFTLTATPGTVQSNDAECLAFTYTQSGLKGVTGTAAATPEVCWK